MIFAFASDDGSLYVLRSEAEAIAQAEGIDVEDGVWRFFDANGSELEPVFVTPNQRGAWTVLSGTYTLHRPAIAGASLKEILPKVTSVTGVLTSVSQVLKALPGVQ